MTDVRHYRAGSCKPREESSAEAERVSAGRGLETRMERTEP